MKANELRMGNLIDVGSLFSPYGSGEVVEILADCVVVKINGSLHQYLYDDIQGISLTDELLIRFGFNYNLSLNLFTKSGFDIQLFEDVAEFYIPEYGNFYK